MLPELHMQWLGSLITVSTYQVLGTVALVLAVLLTGWSYVKNGLSYREAGGILCMLVVGFLLGARVFNGLTNMPYYLKNSEILLAFNWRNFSLYGGILGAGCAGFWTARKIKKDPWALADQTVLGLAVAIAIAKLGCLSNGCCFGIESHLPWAVHYPPGSLSQQSQVAADVLKGNVFSLFSNPKVIPRHPVQLYESFGALMALGVSWEASRRYLVAGTRFLTFIALFSLVRWGAWYYRVPSPSWAMPAGFIAVFYGIIIVVALGLWQKRRRQQRRRSNGTN